MELLILILSFYTTLEIQQLSQYSYITFSEEEDFYLNLDSFKIGDKVYIEVSYDTNDFYYYSFYYKQSNYSSENDFKSYRTFKSISTEDSTKSKDIETKYYTITLSGNYNYLLFKFIGGTDILYTIRHSRTSFTSSSNWKIIAVISIIVGIIVLILIIHWCRTKKGNNSPDIESIDSPIESIETTLTIEKPSLTPLYTQPGFQPYVVQENKPDK